LDARLAPANAWTGEVAIGFDDTGEKIEKKFSFLGCKHRENALLTVQLRGV